MLSGSTRRYAFLFAFLSLVAVRLPTLVEPSGADQDLYSYIGQRILAGAVPYRDAWDQKPPAIHLTYAAMFAVWPHPSVVALTDLLAAIATSLLLLAIGRSLGPVPGTGAVAALLFLFLSNPAFGRLGGVRVRSQCEVFIALSVTAALLLLLRLEPGRKAFQTARTYAAGLLLGVAVIFKYNTVTFVSPALLALVVWPPGRRLESWREWIRPACWLGAGVATPGVIMAAVFLAIGALNDLYQATVSYNIEYSGETYGGVWSVVSHLATFPVRHARLDSLWWLGGLGCAVLIPMSVWRRELLVVPVWVIAACVSIAINGSRGLPQYFLQANPALALAAALLLTVAWVRVGLLGRLALVVLVSTGVWRVTNIPKAIDYAQFDVNRILGRVDRRTYLARFGEAGSDQKYSALAVADLAEFLASNTRPEDTVLIFGFSPGALSQAERRSASRFFWSRPVIVGFNDKLPGYGAQGLMDELELQAPEVVVLQEDDWQDTQDSASYFLNHGGLRAWLQASYLEVERRANFRIWRRTSKSLEFREPQR